MRCPNCGNENPEDYTFCDECGAKITFAEAEASAPVADAADAADAAPPNIENAAALDALADAVASAPTSVATAAAETDAAMTEATCPNCGAVTVPGEAFCNECGAELATAMSAISAPLPDAPTAEADAIPAEAHIEEAMAAIEQSAAADEAVEAAHTPAVAAVAVDDLAAPSEAVMDAVVDAAPPPIAETPAPAPVLAPVLAPMPAPPVAAVGGSTASWAGEALRQLDEAQQAMAKSDFVAYGERMGKLKTYLESVAGGTAVEVAGMNVSAVSAIPSASNGTAAAATTATSGGAIMARLVVIATGAEMPLPQQQEEITVGREDPSSGIFPDVDLTPYGGEDGGVSRRHARLLFIGGEYYVEDLQSTNYTKLDGQRLPARVREKLDDGARIDFGRVAMIFRKG